MVRFWFQDNAPAVSPIGRKLPVNERIVLFSNKEKTPFEGITVKPGFFGDDVPVFRKLGVFLCAYVDGGMFDFNHDTFDLREPGFFSPFNLADQKIHFFVLVRVLHVRLLRRISFEKVPKTGKVYLEVRFSVSNEKIFLSK